MGGKFGDGSKIDRATAKEVAEKFISLLPQSKIISWEICGSYRRQKDKIGDVELFIQLSPSWEGWFGDIVGIAKNGNPRRMYVIDGKQIDLFITEHTEHVGAMKLHCTGSWEFNRNMRYVAIQKGLLLNQYGLWLPIPEDDYQDGPLFYRKRKRKSDPWDCYRQVAGGTEESVFDVLGMEYKSPSER